MTKVPNNYPCLYVSYIRQNTVNLVGFDSQKYDGEISRRKLGGVWGGYERICNSKEFQNLEERNIFLQELINQKVPFGYDDRQMCDPVNSIMSIREQGDVSGLIKTVKITVSYSISVEFSEV